MNVNEGPYYITGTAELTDGDLNYTRLPGEPVRISGRVYGGPDDSRPIVGAKIELWQADASGSYHPNDRGDAQQFSPGEIGLRGYVLTDREGRYEFTTIYPGIYRGRCRHIHARASAQSYRPEVTQLIVPAKPGDAMTPEMDFIARSLPPRYHLSFESKDGVLVSSFDFHLDPA